MGRKVQGFFKKVAVALLGFGREKLKGDDRPSDGLFLGVNVADESHRLESNNAVKIGETFRLCKLKINAS